MFTLYTTIGLWMLITTVGGILVSMAVAACTAGSGVAAQLYLNAWKATSLTERCLFVLSLATMVYSWPLPILYNLVRFVWYYTHPKALEAAMQASMERAMAVEWPKPSPFDPI